MAVLLNNVLFIHCPRTGGTSISEAMLSVGGRYLNEFIPLNPEQKKSIEEAMSLMKWPIKKKIKNKNGPHLVQGTHYTKSELIDHGLLDPSKFLTTFTCIRNPFDGVASQYQKMVSGTLDLGSKNPDTLKHRATLDYLSNPYPFSQFIRRYPLLVTAYATRMCKFKIEADIIIRFESLNEEWGPLCQKLQLPEIALPRSNITPNKQPYIDYYNQDDIAYVKSMIKDQLDILGYS